MEHLEPTDQLLEENRRLREEIDRLRAELSSRVFGVVNPDLIPGPQPNEMPKLSGGSVTMVKKPGEQSIL